MQFAHARSVIRARLAKRSFLPLRQRAELRQNQLMPDVNSRLLEVFAPIARDLASAGLRAKLRMESWVTSEYFWAAALSVEGQSLGGVQVDPATSREGQIEWLAEQVQDYVLEFVRRGPEAVVWPRCRGGHRHPMVIERLPSGSQSWPTWVCPVDRSYRIPVGGGAQDA